MHTYDESSLLSGRKGVAFSAVILLHLLFGFALYSELAVKMGKTLETSPLNVARIAEPTKPPVKPQPLVSLIDSVRIHVAAPETLSMAPPEETSVRDVDPIEPPQTILQPAPLLGASSKVRMDPKHPLRIGEAYYPDASRRANEMGRCVVKVTVASDGRIVAAAIQSSTGFDRLDQACLNAVKGQRMLPATEDGKAIESGISLPIVWNLSDR